MPVVVATMVVVVVEWAMVQCNPRGCSGVEWWW